MKKSEEQKRVKDKSKNIQACVAKPICKIEYKKSSREFIMNVDCEVDKEIPRDFASGMGVNWSCNFNGERYTQKGNKWVVPFDKAAEVVGDDAVGVPKEMDCSVTIGKDHVEVASKKEIITIPAPIKND